MTQKSLKLPKRVQNIDDDQILRSVLVGGRAVCRIRRLLIILGLKWFKKFKVSQ